MLTTTSPSSERPAEPGHVTDRRTTPAGVMPRHLQQWMVLGTVLVMVAILSLSRSPATSHASTAVSSVTSAVDASQQRIEEYQRRIQEQTARLALEEAQLQRTKEAVAPPSAGASRVSPTRGEPD